MTNHAAVGTAAKAQAIPMCFRASVSRGGVSASVKADGHVMPAGDAYIQVTAKQDCELTGSQRLERGVAAVTAHLSRFLCLLQHARRSHATLASCTLVGSHSSKFFMCQQLSCGWKVAAMLPPSQRPITGPCSAMTLEIQALNQAA